MEHKFNVNWICRKCGVSQPSAEAFGYPCEGYKTASSAGGRAILTVGGYVEMVHDLPLPTDAQKQNFAVYVAHAHSWYKHLPAFPPGAAFYFFLNEYAGCNRV